MTHLTDDFMARPDRAITADDMLERGKLMTIDRGMEYLRTTEPVSFVDFETGSNIAFRVADGWNVGLEELHGTTPINAYISTNFGTGASTEYQLTKDALLEAAGMCGLSTKYTRTAPVTYLVEDPLNYFFQTGLDLKLKLMLVGEDQAVTAITRSSVQPFSNVEMVERAVQQIHHRHPGIDVFIDATKVAHSFRRSFIQLVIPDLSRSMQDTGQEHDNWWGGIQLSNSLTGEIQTSIDGFLYRLLCTNGMIDVGTSAGSWNRRSGGQNEEDVYAWAQEAVDGVLGRFDGAFDTVQTLTGLSIEGEVSAAARDVFEQHQFPVRSRQRVLDELVENDQLTMYALVNAITAAANSDDLKAEDQQRLMRAGGDVASHAERCGSCHRLLPDGQTRPAQE